MGFVSCIVDTEGRRQIKRWLQGQPSQPVEKPLGVRGPHASQGRAASARGAFLALPCSLGFRLAPPATGGARLPPEAIIGFGGVYGKSAKSLA